MEQYTSVIDGKTFLYELSGKTLSCQQTLGDHIKITLDLSAEGVKISRKTKFDQRFKSGVVVSIVPILTFTVLSFMESQFPPEMDLIPAISFICILLLGIYFVIAHWRPYKLAEIMLKKEGINIFCDRNNTAGYNEFVRLIEETRQS